MREVALLGRGAAVARDVVQQQRQRARRPARHAARAQVGRGAARQLAHARDVHVHPVAAHEVLQPTRTVHVLRWGHSPRNVTAGLHRAPSHLIFFFLTSLVFYIRHGNSSDRPRRRKRPRAGAGSAADETRVAARGTAGAATPPFRTVLVF